MQGAGAEISIAAVRWEESLNRVFGPGIGIRRDPASACSKPFDGKLGSLEIPFELGID
jgi:hypothetical protein